MGKSFNVERSETEEAWEKLKDKFIQLSDDYALPYTFDPECKNEIIKIIDTGILQLKKLPHNEHEKIILSSKKSMGNIIKLMKTHAKKNPRARGSLTNSDLKHAKVKACPTWPCNN